MKQSFFFIAFFFAFAVLFDLSESVAQQRDPKIGYVYPAGGQRGTTFQVLVGGRQIARSTEVLVSGNGVRGRVLHTYPSMRINDSDERRLFTQLYQEALKKAEGKTTPSSVEKEKMERKEARKSEQNKDEPFRKNGNQLLSESANVPEKELPTPEEILKKYPYAHFLLNPTMEDLERIYDFYFAPRQERKPVEALGQGVLVEITIDEDAEPGSRDFRLLDPNGMTSPIRFMVGIYPEIFEREPNDTIPNSDERLEIWGKKLRDAPKSIAKQLVYDLPRVFNGQIRAGDIDRFQFNARAGQELVIDVRARFLIPYLADAVPGWFQAAVSLYDSNGEKIAEAMSWRHEADPLLTVNIPKSGVYVLEIQDSIFRGRDDFVYRITVAESPFITSMFPLGVRQGYSQGADITAFHLSESAILLDGEKRKPGIYEISSVGNNTLIRPVRYAVDDLPEIIEKEPNNNLEQAEALELPLVVNGRILDKDDEDWFSFEGKKGQKIVVDVSARSLDSPLDAAVELLDGKGRQIASNDDRADSNGPNVGLETHHADPYLNVELPEDGKYFVRLYDTMHQGGKEFAYRLRLSSPRPGFDVYCEPSSLTFRGSGEVPLKVHVVRKDGFDGELELRLPDFNDFQLKDALIPAGAKEATVKLIALPRYQGRPREIRIEAVATIDGKKTACPVVAVDDMEQAFIYHHWVPAKSFVVCRAKGFRNPSRKTSNSK